MKSQDEKEKRVKINITKKEIPDKVIVKFGKTEKTFDVNKEKDPDAPHITIDTDKTLHGWEYYSYPDKHHRECSQERALINAYNGCRQNGCQGCFFCYTKSLQSSYFRLFWKEGVSTVALNFDEEIEYQLSELYACPELYISPVTDGFMDMELIYDTHPWVMY